MTPIQEQIKMQQEKQANMDVTLNISCSDNAFQARDGIQTQVISQVLRNFDRIH